MERYLVIVSRNRPELFGTLASIYGQKGEVEICFDRRKGQPWTGMGDRPERRAQLSLATEHQEHGFLVIRRPEMVGASR